MRNLTDKDAGRPYLALKKTPLEEQIEQQVYSQVHDQMQRTITQILRETGKPQMTADDLAPQAR